MKKKIHVRVIGCDDPRAGQHLLRDVFKNHPEFLFDTIILELQARGIFTAEELIGACSIGFPRPEVLDAKQWDQFLEYAAKDITPAMRKSLSVKVKRRRFGVIELE